MVCALHSSRELAGGYTRHAASPPSKPYINDLPQIITFNTRDMELIRELARRQVPSDNGSGAFSLSTVLEGAARGALKGAEAAWDSREVMDEYVRRELQEEGSGASWLSTIWHGAEDLGRLFGGSGNSSRRDVEFNSELARRQVPLDNGSGAFSIGKVLEGAARGALKGAEASWDLRELSNELVARKSGGKSIADYVLADAGHAIQAFLRREEMIELASREIEMRHHHKAHKAHKSHHSIGDYRAHGNKHSRNIPELEHVNKIPVNLWNSLALGQNGQTYY
ncbi:hypothetical protein B0H21DRAFT_355949 [Amylocystis lapponica]|nr:hypothetical protein B0H21DRAFT_355949 [Amylocystis lapponica]